MQNFADCNCIIPANFPFDLYNIKIFWSHNGYLIRKHRFANDGNIGYAIIKPKQLRICQINKLI